MQITAAAGLALLACACDRPVEAPAAPDKVETAQSEAATPPEAGGNGAAAEPKSGLWKPPGDDRLLTWDDLMPAGEEEKLNRLYQDYYLALQYERRKNQTMLTMRGVEDDTGVIEEGSAADFMPQLGTFETVAELDGRDIRIPAYIVPLEFSDDHLYREFLLVPYMGACIHTPPPPPNQIIYVNSEKPVRIDDIWAPYYADGVLTTKKHENEVGSAAYTLALTKLEPYKF